MRKFIIFISTIIIMSQFAFAKNYDISQISQAKLVTSYSEDTTVDQMDTVTFGSYPQSDISGSVKEPIEWIVLDKRDDKALLLSKYVIDNKCYNDNKKSVTWETCTLRNWLNNTFYNNAFNNDEKQCIKTTYIENVGSVDYTFYHTVYDAEGGEDTNDKVFLLNKYEVLNYFKQSGDKEVKKITTKATEYAKSIVNNKEQLSLYSSNEKYEKWALGNVPFWLRSAVHLNNRIDNISGYRGHLSRDEMDRGFIGVRPALWINLNNTNDNIVVKDDRSISDLSNQIKNVKTVIEYSEDTMFTEMDTVKFGLYPQSDVFGYDKDPIEWFVLEKDESNHKALLFSKYILDFQVCATSEQRKDHQFHLTYGNSYVRHWLNNIFIKRAFDKNEMDKLVETNTLLDNDKYDVDRNNKLMIIQDKVYLLKYKHCEIFFGTKTTEINKRMATSYTPYSKYLTGLDEFGKDLIEKGAWLLNNFINNEKYALADGSVPNTVGGNKFGIRPAIWVKY